MKAVLLVRSLGVGGAERQLVTLARGLARRGHDVLVLAFYSGGPLEGDLVDAGIRVHALGKRGRWDTVGFLRRLRAVLARERPGVVHSYHTTPNCVATSVRVTFPRVRLVWSVRSSIDDLSAYDGFARLTARVEPRLARFCDWIIVNSAAGRVRCVRTGFPEAKLVVVRNGIDTEAFRPSAAQSAAVRAEIGLSPEDRVVGLVARLDPVKDHATFLRAAALVLRRRPGVRFLCVGGGPDEYRRALHALATELGIEQAVRWLPTRGDMPAVQNALDVAVLSSSSEGLPNSIAEAMACGIPCVVTDVGDARWLVGELGEVVPPREPASLAGGILRLLDKGRDGPEASARRRRVRDLLGLERLVADTERVLFAAG